LGYGEKGRWDVDDAGDWSAGCYESDNFGEGRGIGSGFWSEEAGVGGYVFVCGKSGLEVVRRWVVGSACGPCGGVFRG